MGLWTFLHVPAHMITVGDFQSDWRKCNPIKSSKVNGDGKKHRSVPEVFLAASPLVASAEVSAFGQHRKLNSRRTREKPLVHRVVKHSSRPFIGKLRQNPFIVSK